MLLEKLGDTCSPMYIEAPGSPKDGFREGNILLKIKISGGRGDTKKDAQQDACRRALEFLGQQPSPPNFRNQIQEFCQKNSQPIPVVEEERVVPHGYQGTVSLNFTIIAKGGDTVAYWRQKAAKQALQFIGYPELPTERPRPSPATDYFRYSSTSETSSPLNRSKNILQEYVAKQGLPYPKYSVTDDQRCVVTFTTAGVHLGPPAASREEAEKNASYTFLQKKSPVPLKHTSDYRQQVADYITHQYGEQPVFRTEFLRAEIDGLSYGCAILSKCITEKQELNIEGEPSPVLQTTNGRKQAEKTVAQNACDFLGISENL